ncbi:hypothetical protein AT984_02725 [Paucibacter sp. KCTC 42545]|nr:hypothetical protein AT984_02725 [Paucibacter sp. KCTC 42545]
MPTSTISGNVGVWSSGGANAITGFLSSPGLAVADPQVTSGLVHAGTAGAAAAQGQLTSAITNLSSLGVGTLLGADLVGMTLTPGVYTVPAGTSNLSGVLILDGQGNANAAWVFQMASTLITSANSVVSVTNTGQGAGVFWNVASSATLGSNTSFMGNILAVASISLNTGARDNCGRVLAKTGAVTLQMNTLSNSCTGLLSGSDGLGGGLDVTTSPEGITSVAFLPFAPITPNVPEPASLALFGIGICGICGLGAFRRRRG